MDEKFSLLLKNGDFSCIVARNGTLLYEAKGIGVKPLLELYNKKPEALVGSEVYDTVIGKAAAVILILGGASFVFGAVMSEVGRDFLEAHGVKTAYGELVPMIRNRTNTDFCPLEKSVYDLSDLQGAFSALNETIAALMGGKNGG